MIEIDGSFGEGGGQIVRTAAALSAVTGKGVHITKIRQARPKPGLAAQHARALMALAEICDARISGVTAGSSEITFTPGEIRGGRYRIEIGTAGSVTLLMQCLMPALLCADEPSSLQIQGGTDVQWSPTVDYFKNVFLPALSTFGTKASLEVLRRGYYPRGQGEVLLQVQPAKLMASSLVKADGRGGNPPVMQAEQSIPAAQNMKTDQNVQAALHMQAEQRMNPAQTMQNIQNLQKAEGSCVRVQGISHCSNLPEHVAIRQAESAEEVLGEAGFMAQVDHEVAHLPSLGSGITLWSGFKGASSLGKKGFPAERVGGTAAEELIAELKSSATVDVHLADQIIPYLALAGGSFTVREISLHAKTNIWTARRFLDADIGIEEKNGIFWIEGLL
ncbi:MAG: RNA 3'-terminal phosphate cyclase [Methanothrix sp.]|nr:RNA 3'-terminal phosphate cyclase [Methanothrix sp.]